MKQRGELQACGVEDQIVCFVERCPEGELAARWQNVGTELQGPFGRVGAPKREGEHANVNAGQRGQWVEGQATEGVHWSCS